MPLSERTIKSIFGDREFDMPEIVTIRSECAFNKLDIRNRFVDYDSNTEKLIQSLMNDL